MSYDPKLYGVAFVKAGLHQEDDFKVFLAEDQYEAIEMCKARGNVLIIKGVYLSLSMEDSEP